MRGEFRGQFGTRNLPREIKVPRKSCIRITICGMGLTGLALPAVCCGAVPTQADGQKAPPCFTVATRVACCVEQEQTTSLASGAAPPHRSLKRMTREWEGPLDPRVRSPPARDAPPPPPPHPSPGGNGCQRQGLSLIRTLEKKCHSYIFVHFRTFSCIFVSKKKAKSR